MRFGYFIGQDVPHGGDPAVVVREAIAEARAAEAAGFDGVFASEHHGVAAGYLGGTSAGYLPAAIPLMYLLAHETSGVDIGSAVMLLSLAQPTRVAEELALLDHLTGGRLILGVGAGYLQEDFDAYGIDRTRAGSRMEEGVELLRRLWSEPRVDHEGAYYRLAGATVFPPPLTPGGPPIWIGGRSEIGVRRAARLADAWILDATPRRELFRPWHERYLEEAAAAGRQPRTAILRDGWLDLGSSLDDEYREAVLTTSRGKLAAGVYSEVDPEFGARRPEDVTFAEIARDRWLVGDVESIHAELDAWESQLGIEYMVLRLRTRGLPSHAAALEQLAAFGEQVIAGREARGATRLRV